MIHKNQILKLKITDLAFGGKGIAQVNDFIIFVDGGLPGQTVNARISLKKKQYAEAKILKIIKKSQLEIKNPYQAIPGAPWANLPIKKQQKFKKTLTINLFKKIAQENIESVFDEFISSPKTWNYRNKMEFSFGFSDENFKVVEIPINPHFLKSKTKKIWHHYGFALGSKKRGQFWLVENLEKPSGLFDEDFEKCIPKIRELFISTGLQPFNQRKNEGFFRHLVVRKSFYENKFLINLVTTVPIDTQYCRVSIIKNFKNLILKHLNHRIAGIYWTQNNAVSDSVQNYKQRELVYGEKKIIEKINDLEFEISIDSFFQTNIHSAQLLYKKVIQYLNLNKTAINQDHTILDLFCGTGTIGQIIAKQMPKTKIIGVEIIKSAIEDAKKNAQRNGLKNIDFVCTDVKKFLKAEKDNLSSNTTVIIDPPRAGIAPKSLQKIIDFTPIQIIYVSCNPATMARDTKSLKEAGYKLEKISLIDQFPHTSHIECVGSFINHNFKNFK